MSLTRELTDVYEERPFYAVGDIHGDFSLLVHILEDVAQVMKKDSWKTTKSKSKSKPQWTGGSNLIVFCGDLIDPIRPKQGLPMWRVGKVVQKRPGSTNDDAFHLRGSDTSDDDGGDDAKAVRKEAKRNVLQEEMLIIDTLRALNMSALSQGEGGRVIMLLGNHEMTHFEGHADFAGRYSYIGGDNYFVNKMNLRAERVKQFKKGGVFYKGLKNVDTVRRGVEGERFMACVKIGNVVMCHGGITLGLRKKVEKIRGETFETMGSMVTFINETLSADVEVLASAQPWDSLAHTRTSGYFDCLFGHDTESVVWNRQWSESFDPSKMKKFCKQRTIGFTKEKGLVLVVAHTVQNYRGNERADAYVPSVVDSDQESRFALSGPLKNMNRGRAFCCGINSDCTGSVWRLDASMSQAFGRRRNEVDFSGDPECWAGATNPQCIYVDQKNERKNSERNNELKWFHQFDDGSQRNPGVTVLISRKTAAQPNLTEKQSVESVELYVEQIKNLS